MSLKVKSKFKKAFTLIELSLVVITLGIIFTMVETTGSTEKDLKEKTIMIKDAIKQSLLETTFRTNNGLTQYSLEPFKNHSDSAVRNLTADTDALKFLRIKDSLIFQEAYYNVLSFESGTSDFLKTIQYEREGCEERRLQVKDRTNGILQTAINYNTIKYTGFTDKCKLTVDKGSKTRNLGGVILKRIFNDSSTQKAKMFIFQDRSAKTDYFIGDGDSEINSHWVNHFNATSPVNSQIQDPKLSKKIYLEFGADSNLNTCDIGTDFYDITIGFGQKDKIKNATDKNLICLSLDSSLIRNFIFK